jgi:hypothetical protein
MQTMAFRLPNPSAALAPHMAAGFRPGRLSEDGKPCQLLRSKKARSDPGLSVSVSQRFPPQIEIDRVRHVLETDDRHRPVKDRIRPA